MKKKKKVLLAMSGGVDSSVAAIVLLEQGFEVVGATYRVWDSVSEDCLSKETGCCSIDNILEAKNLAKELKIEHHILDYRDYFRKTVIENFITEYTSLRTPNPCAYCNYIIKWGKLLDFAQLQQCDFIATGHYARIVQKGETYYLMKGIDQEKDQSYFLWMLNQKQLQKTIFPLGNYTKKQVREIAAKNGFSKLSKKSESQEICFIPDNDYRSFLKNNIPDFSQRFKEGKILLSDGHLLGKHNGLPFYTIGQRKGIKVAAGYPVYVTRLDKTNNSLILGKYEELLKTSFTIENIHFADEKNIQLPVSAQTKIRFRNKGTSSQIFSQNGKYIVRFNEPVAAVTPGQSAVFYQDDVLLGGGIISTICDE